MELRKPILLSILLCVLLSCLPATEAHAQRRDALQAAVLTSGEGYFVHAVPVMPGYVITYTMPATGVMKPLLKAAPPANAPSTKSTKVRHCAGVVADQERLYVLVAERNEPVRPREDQAPFALTLHAFALSDGKRLMGEGLAFGTSEKAPETLGIGLLKLTETGVECGENKVEFDGRTLTQVHVDGRQFTPPPDLFEERRFNY